MRFQSWSFSCMVDDFFFFFMGGVFTVQERTCDIEATVQQKTYWEKLYYTFILKKILLSSIQFPQKDYETVLTLEAWEEEIYSMFSYRSSHD